MAALLSRYFEKADVSIFTDPPQNHPIQATPTNCQPAMGILVGSTKSSCKTPDEDLGPRSNDSRTRRAVALLNIGPHGVVALACGLAIAVFFLSGAAVYFVGGQASPSTGVAPEGIQTGFRAARVLESVMDWAKKAITLALPADEKPANIQASDVEAPAAELPEIKDVPLAFERLGTSVDFLRDPDQAAHAAGKQGKLLFVLHVSGDFEDAALT